MGSGTVNCQGFFLVAVMLWICGGLGDGGLRAQDAASRILALPSVEDAVLDAEGYVTGLRLSRFYEIDYFGELEVFPRLSQLTITYSGDVFDEKLSGCGLLENLSSLTLVGASDLSGPGLDMLKYLPKLEELYLSETYMLNSPAPLANLRSLKRLILKNTYFTWQLLANEKLASQIGVEELVLQGFNQVKPADWQFFAKLPELRTLQLIDNDEITDDDLAAFATASKLRAIVLRNCPKITGEFLDKLENIPLEDLTIWSSRLPYEHLDSVGSFANLKRLNLKSTATRRRSANDQNTSEPNWLARLSRLEELEIDSRFFEPSWLRLLQANPQLRRLSLKFSRGPKQDEVELPWLADLPLVEVLRLAGVKPLPASWFTPVQQGQGRLQELVLEACQLDEEAIVALSRCSSIERLGLINCGLTDAAAARLVALENLTVLDLMGNSELTDATLVQLAQLPRLKRLRITGCKNISGSGFAAFALDHPLETAVLKENNGITPAGLAALLQLQQLNEVEFHHDKLNREHLQVLKDSRPIAKLDVEPRDRLDSLAFWELCEIHSGLGRQFRRPAWEIYFESSSGFGRR